MKCSEHTYPRETGSDESRISIPFFLEIVYTLDIDGTLTLVGIVSKGKMCNKEGFPGIYTNVQAFRTWLDESKFKRTSLGPGKFTLAKFLVFQLASVDPI